MSMGQTKGGAGDMLREVVIDLPVLAYEHLQKLASAQRRELGAVASDLILAELPAIPPLPVEMERELAAFSQLSNEVLTLLAKSTLSAQELAQLAQLNEQAQAGKLLPAQEVRRQQLLDAYDRVLVRRAQAALVLRMRGQIESPLQ
jgi:hypothetical protein